MTQDYIMSVAQNIRKQLYALTEPKAICSWGIEYPLIGGKYKDMPTLEINVDARLFQGRVMIALNEEKDIYEIYLKKDGEQPILLADNVFFEDLGDIIDTAIESGTDKAEYEAFCEQERQKLLRKILS